MPEVSRAFGFQKGVRKPPMTCDRVTMSLCTKQNLAEQKSANIQMAPLSKSAANMDVGE